MLRAIVYAALGASVLGGAVALPANFSRADVMQRSAPAAGSVISRKVGEEVQFIDVASWRGIDAEQDLLAGDVLRTNALGHLAVLFRDRTQVRLGRNTTLLVKEVGEASDSRFGLTGGTIWARAERGGAGLTVDTPAAAAAIRGTDWTLTVDASGKTSLIVLEGRVDLSNEFGSVSVGQGEAAVAAIGQAPTKVIIVAPKDREQMLFYLSLRIGFNVLPASPLSGTRMRGERDRIAAMPRDARTQEDRVTLAEVSLTYEGRAAAREAVAAARAGRLTQAQEARLTLVEAMIAGAERRYTQAAALFARAERRLDPRRRAMAAYGGYFSRSLADPERVETAPRLDGASPYGALAAALTAGFLQDIPAAFRVLAQAEARFPDDPTLPAARAQFAMLVDDREQAEAAFNRALALDPDDPTALEARALFRSGYKGDVQGAYADLKRASTLAPGSTTIWNSLGNIEGERGADREAEAAFRRSIELDPEDPASRANLAILLMEQGRLDEAKAEIDRAMALDPAFDIGLIALGLYYLHSGDIDKGIDTMLKGSTANPSYAQAQLLLSAAYYEGGQREPAEQALENANRLDPNDPVTALFDAAIAIDDYDSDRAIKRAQEAMKRARARGGDFAPASANRQEGSALNEAFRLQGLEAWGRFYGDLTFDPFAGASYVDQTVSGSANPFFNTEDFRRIGIEPEIAGSGFSTFFQGILLDPLSISGRSRSANLIRRPFLEGSLGGGLVNQGGEWNWNADIQAQAHANNPVPWSMLADISGLETETRREFTTGGAPAPNGSGDFGLRNVNAFAFLTAQPTPQDHVIAFLNASNERDEISNLVAVPFPPDPLIGGVGFTRDIDEQSLVSSVGWSHTFGYRNVANVAGFYNRQSEATNQNFGLLVDSSLVFGGAPTGTQIVQGAVTDTERSSDGFIAAANHLVGVGDVTFRYGVEAGRIGSDTTTITDPYLILPGNTFVPLARDTTAGTADIATARLYADILYEPHADLTFEAGAFVSHIGLPDNETTRLDPRIGVAWSPVDGHWLRAGYIRDTAFLNTATLAPVGVVGLQANSVGFAATGFADTFAARWDAQWTDRFFTSVDAQHQQLHDLSIDVPLGLATVDLARGEITRVSATANYSIGSGFGLFATGVYTESENRTPGLGFGDALPFVPDFSGRAGVTYVNPANVKATLAATYIGERFGDFYDRPKLDGYWTLDAFLTWEPFDKRFALELAAYNILDTSFLLTNDLPGWGQTFTGSFKVRF